MGGFDSFNKVGAGKVKSGGIKFPGGGFTVAFLLLTDLWDEVLWMQAGREGDLGEAAQYVECLAVEFFILLVIHKCQVLYSKFLVKQELPLGTCCVSSETTLPSF